MEESVWSKECCSWSGDVVVYWLDRYGQVCNKGGMGRMMMGGDDMGDDNAWRR